MQVRVVARTVLGASCRMNRPQREAQRPPDGPDGRPLDSVWAAARADGGAVDHVEVMLYEKAQVRSRSLCKRRLNSRPGAPNLQ